MEPTKHVIHADNHVSSKMFNCTLLVTSHVDTFYFVYFGLACLFDQLNSYLFYGNNLIRYMTPRCKYLANYIWKICFLGKNCKLVRQQLPAHITKTKDMARNWLLKKYIKDCHLNEKYQFKN